MRFWERAFRNGTVINTVAAHPAAAVPFFGMLAVMRRNLFELHKIFAAQRIRNLTQREALALVRKMRKAAVAESAASEHTADDVFTISRLSLMRSSVCVSGSLDAIWAIGVSAIHEGQASKECVKVLRHRATELLIEKGAAR